MLACELRREGIGQGGLRLNTALPFAGTATPRFLDSRNSTSHEVLPDLEEIVNCFTMITPSSIKSSPSDHSRRHVLPRS